MWLKRSLVLLAVAAFAVAGCGRQEANPTPPPCTDADGGAAVDPALLAFLSAARSAHHQADLREQDGDLAAATRALEALIGSATPAGERPEVSEVLADTHARLADLRGRLGQLAQAEQSIELGLKLAPGKTYYRGHLFEVRGLIQERQAEGLAKAGREDDARRARERALEAFEEAMRIQQHVIEKATPKAP